LIFPSLHDETTKRIKAEDLRRRGRTANQNLLTGSREKRRDEVFESEVMEGQKGNAKQVKGNKKGKGGRSLQKKVGSNRLKRGLFKFLWVSN
jgi:hypothetical protein